MEKYQRLFNIVKARVDEMLDRTEYIIDNSYEPSMADLAKYDTLKKIANMIEEVENDTKSNA